jgi:hypothetical protein
MQFCPSSPYKYPALATLVSEGYSVFCVIMARRLWSCIRRCVDIHKSGSNRPRLDVVYLFHVAQESGSGILSVMTMNLDARARP